MNEAARRYGIGTPSAAYPARIEPAVEAAPLVITANSSAPVSAARKGRRATAISLCPMKMVTTAENDSIGEVPSSFRKPAPRNRANACITPRW